MSEKCLWINNHFINKNQYAPFIVAQDNDYYDDLRMRYKNLYKDAKIAGADESSLKLIHSYSEKICKAIRNYYNGNIGTCHNIIKNLVGRVIDNTMAVDTINNSDAFPGVRGTEVQFFRARINPVGLTFEAKDMLHLPFKMRGKTGNYRFSIPGVPSIYLGNTSYSCWLELGRPSEHDFMVSPVLVDNSIRVFNLAVMTRDMHRLDSFEIERVHCWLILIMLMMATSYTIRENNRVFYSEYIVSQSIMLACKKYGLDGVAYYSKRVDDEIFAFPAVNVALFAQYKSGKQYAEVCNHIKVGNSFNFALFKQLNSTSFNNNYRLRCLRIAVPNNIGNYERYYPYKDTQFAEFDKFLFSGWDHNNIEFGNAIM